MTARNEWRRRTRMKWQDSATLTAPYRHQSMPVENTWSHDVPRSMILLHQGPGKEYLQHFLAAFLCQERASNRTVKPRQQNDEMMSAEMLFFGSDYSQINMLFIFWSPVFYLVHPEARDSKFKEHAKPAVYYGPSRDTDSERYCLLWDGRRSFTVDIGCMRIDESQLITRMSKTNKALQPFTLEPDAEPSMPNFDQWTTPSLTNTTGGQNEPDVITDELDIDIVPGDPDPSRPFVIFIGSGRRRLGEVGHYIKRITSGAVGIVNIDPKRRGYSHNVLIPRVLDWVMHLAKLVICIAVILSIPCSPWGPQKLNTIDGGPKVLFNAKYPDGVPLPSGNIDSMAAGALHLAEVSFNIARAVDAHDGKVIVETPANHGKNSLWPIKGREEHSTLFDTSLFKSFTEDVRGEIVYSDQCMTGAKTRKTTQWYCNLAALPKAIKFLGESMCPGPQGGHDHSTSLVGKDENGKWRSAGSDEYTSNLCGRLAHIVLDDEVVESPTPATPTEEPAGGGGEDFTTTVTISGDVNENESDLPVEIELPIEIESSTEALAEPFDAVKLALEANLHPATHHESQLDAVLEEDTQGEAPVARPAARKGGKVCGTKLSNGDHCVLKPFHLGNCEPPITKGTTAPAMQTYAGAVNDLYRKQEKSPTFVHQGEKVVAFPDDMGTPDDVGTESNESYVPFVAACERFSQGIKHWSKTTHADWLRSMTKQDVIKLINASKANDKIGVGNKGHNEAVASYSISRLPFMEQYVNEYDAINATIGNNAGAPSNPSSPRGPNAPWVYRPRQPEPKPPDTPRPKGNPSPSNPKPGNKKPPSAPVLAPTTTDDSSDDEDDMPGLIPSEEEFRQASDGDVGTKQVISALVQCTKDVMTSEASMMHYSECMQTMEESVANNTDAFSVISHQYDIEGETMLSCNIVTAIVNGVEMVIDPNDPSNWHTPKNEREYLRSPQKAAWRTAREKKMDQYQELKVFKLVPRKGIDPKCIMGSLWANKIKFDESGKFLSLGPRWCVKGFAMDKSIYTGFSEVCLTTTIKMMAAIRATYRVKDFLFDASNAFQATRTDDGTVKSEKLYCTQAPGFSVKDSNGVPMICEILVALQGRVDAARLFGQRLEQILFKLGARRSTWDPKAYFFHFGPLTDTAATLDEVLAACQKVEAGNDKNGCPNGWAVLAVHVDDCPGIASSDRLINYIKAGIETQYKVTHAPWKKVLGFKFECTESSVTMSAMHTIETMYKTFLQGQLKYDARMPGRDVKLTNGEAPAAGDPRLATYLEMQSETRSLLGLLLWVSLAYPQISYHVNRACGFMSNPSHEVNAYAKHIAMHLYQYPIPVTWGGCTSLELSVPTVAPFTDGAKEYGLHFAADASPDDAARGITGGVGMLAGGAILTISSRQHLATPDMHANEVLAAGTIMHKIVPLRGFLTEARIPQEHGTPLYIDSASTVFVAQSRGAVKKSAWIRRRSEVLTEAFDMGECDPIKIEEYNNFSDPQTKYLVYRVWMRHLHYTHNLAGDPPPPVDKSSKKMSPSSVLVNMTKKNFLFAMGL